MGARTRALPLRRTSSTHRRRKQGTPPLPLSPRPRRGRSRRGSPCHRSRRPSRSLSSRRRRRKRRRVSRQLGIPVEIARNWLEYSRSVHTRDSGKVGKRVCGNICSSSRIRRDRVANTVFCDVLFIDVIMLLFLYIIKRIVYSSLSLAPSLKLAHLRAEQLEQLCIFVDWILRF